MPPHDIDQSIIDRALAACNRLVRFVAAIDNTPNPADPWCRAHLDRALVNLFHAYDLRLGYLRDDCLARATEHLEAAGLPDLAAQVYDAAGFGGDLWHVESAIRAMLRER